jgi:hypothetical protein
MSGLQSPAKALLFVTASILDLGPTQPKHEADHSPPLSTEIKMRGILPLLTNMAHGVVRKHAFTERPDNLELRKNITKNV